MANSNVLSPKNGKSGCQSQTIVTTKQLFGRKSDEKLKFQILVCAPRVIFLDYPGKSTNNYLLKDEGCFIDLIEVDVLADALACAVLPPSATVLHPSDLRLELLRRLLPGTGIRLVTHTET